jgi:hypothetical protein
LTALREQERFVDDLGEQVRIVDAPRALHERPIDLVLRAVGVQIHFLDAGACRSSAKDVAGNDDHRDAIERGVGDAVAAFGEARAKCA